MFEDLLADVPDDACPPRIMTGRHPRAAASLGADMLAWSDRQGFHPKRSDGWRWWQRLVAERALEVDEAGRLVWALVIVSAPRQSGKSWLERAMLAWRIGQADRWGESQTVLHTAHKLAAAQEVWSPAARWAARDKLGYRVRWTNGEQMIERRACGSRWLIQAANDGAGVAFSLSMALVDEAWRVARPVVDAAIGPTLIEAASPQLWLVSTAGDSDSDLMETNRTLAIAEADTPASTLILEWSAPPGDDVDVDDPAVWRAASPHWDARREERVAEMRSVSTEYQFRQQWLNQWVPTVGVPLLDPVVWQSASDYDGPAGPICFGFDVAADRSSAVIVACGGQRLEVVRAEAGVGWVAGELRRLVERWDPPQIIGDKHGPAVTVFADLADEIGDRLRAVTTSELVAACGEFFDACQGPAPTVAHRPHPSLDGAVSSASKRAVGGSWAFARVADGHVLIAAALAAYADRRPAVVDAPAIF